MQDVNTKGVFLCCKHGIPYLLERGGGSVINVASFVAILGAATSQISYTASKGAVLSMSRELAVQFAREGDPRQRALPGAGRDAAAAQHLRRRPGRARAAADPLADGPAREAARDRERRALPRERRVVVRERRDVPRRRRAHRRLRHARVVDIQAASTRRRPGRASGGSRSRRASEKEDRAATCLQAERRVHGHRALPADAPSALVSNLRRVGVLDLYVVRCALFAGPGSSRARSSARPGQRFEYRCEVPRKPGFPC